MKNTQQTSKEGSLQSSLNKEENYPPMPDDPYDYQEEGMLRGVKEGLRRIKERQQQKQESPRK
ncbi:hypothetical protein [Candidatus Brocadia sinica]|uniref:hypothetical protein n=1 Tax=Candidatus Brocadia sinica TaxID=795830 RepID=UPI0012FECA0B|nr:hypothetical protein [Candidatus Brocadia sinica]MBL1168950.1 hypothetical protein [Candidatus Brocadia sp. AMX1]NOG41903.1 hypothetical protein [Planctomycetota bacterium]